MKKKTHKKRRIDIAITLIAAIATIALIILLVKLRSPQPQDDPNSPGSSNAGDADDPFIDPVMAIEQVDQENGDASTDAPHKKEPPLIDQK